MSVEPITTTPLTALSAQAAQSWAGVGRAVLRLPATLCYAATLSGVTLVTAQLDSATRARIVRAASTNLHNLGGGRVSTLLTSAFVTDGQPPATWWFLLAALMAAIELRWGSWRSIGVFAAGHIGATLLVAAGLAVGVRLGWASPGVAHAVDVGVSYGVMALVGAVTAGLPAAARPVWAAAWVLTTAASVVINQNFTSAGHLCALLIGLAIAAPTLFRERAVSPRGADRSS